MNAAFTADVMVPTVVSLEWSLLRFIVRGGQRRIEVRTGITIRGIAQQTPSNTLTVPQAQRFCATRPRLATLLYAVYFHGYFEGIHDPMCVSRATDSRWLSLRAARYPDTSLRLARRTSSASTRAPIVPCLISTLPNQRGHA